MAKASKRTKPRKARTSRVSQVSQNVKVGGGSDGKPQIIVVQAPGGGGGGGASSSSTAGGGRDTGTNILGPPVFQSPQAPVRPGPFTPVWGNGGYPDGQYSGGYNSGQRAGFAGGSFWNPTPDGPVPSQVGPHAGSSLSSRVYDERSLHDWTKSPGVYDALDPEGGTSGGGIPTGRGVDADAAAQVETHQGAVVPTSTNFELAVRQSIGNITDIVSQMPGHFQGLIGRLDALEHSSALVSTQNVNEQQQIMGLLHQLNQRLVVAENSGTVSKEQQNQMMQMVQHLHYQLDSTRKDAENVAKTLEGQIDGLKDVADDHADRVDDLSRLAAEMTHNNGISAAGGGFGTPMALTDAPPPNQLTVHGTTPNPVDGTMVAAHPGTGPQTGALINPLAPGRHLEGGRAGPVHDALTFRTQRERPIYSHEYFQNNPGAMIASSGLAPHVNTSQMVPSAPGVVVDNAPFGAGQQDAMAIEGQLAAPMRLQSDGRHNRLLTEGPHEGDTVPVNDDTAMLAAAAAMRQQFIG